jgi:hypothetical protein
MDWPAECPVELAREGTHRHLYCGPWDLIDIAQPRPKRQVAPLIQAQRYSPSGAAALQPDPRLGGPCELHDRQPCASQSALLALAVGPRSAARVPFLFASLRPRESAPPSSGTWTSGRACSHISGTAQGRPHGESSAARPRGCRRLGTQSQIGVWTTSLNSRPLVPHPVSCGGWAVSPELADVSGPAILQVEDSVAAGLLGAEIGAAGCETVLGRQNESPEHDQALAPNRQHRKRGILYCLSGHPHLALLSRRVDG